MDHFCYLCFVFVMLSCLAFVAFFPVWCPGSVVVLDCIDFGSLHPYSPLHLGRHCADGIVRSIPARLGLILDSLRIYTN